MRRNLGIWFRKASTRHWPWIFNGNKLSTCIQAMEKELLCIEHFLVSFFIENTVTPHLYAADFAQIRAWWMCNDHMPAAQLMMFSVLCCKCCATIEELCYIIVYVPFRVISSAWLDITRKCIETSCSECFALTQ